MQVIFINDPDCLVSPFIRAVLYVAEIIGENLHSWPLLEPTSTPVQRAWVHAISEAPTGEVDLETLVKLLRSLGLNDIGTMTKFDQYLELILLSMPQILIDRFFKCVLSCTSCGNEHSSFFTVLSGTRSEVSFLDSAKCLACKKCHQSSFVVKAYPIIMLFSNGVGMRLRDTPTSYMELGAHYELLSMVHAPFYGKRPKYILRQWLLDRNNKDINSVMYQFERASKGVKGIQARTIQAALSSAGEPTLSRYGLLIYLMYMRLDIVSPPEKAKYLSVISSFAQSYAPAGSALSTTSPYLGAGTVGLLYNNTISGTTPSQIDVPFSNDQLHTIELNNNYSGSFQKEKQFPQLSGDRLVQSNLLAGTITMPNTYQKQSNPTPTLETAMIRISSLEQKLNSYNQQQTLHYTGGGSPFRVRSIGILGLRIELWLLITLSVMAFFILLTFILACVGVSRQRTSATVN